MKTCIIWLVAGILVGYLLSARLAPYLGKVVSPL